MQKQQKITIIGAGAIGTQTALYLQQDSMYQKNLKRKIILYNHNFDLTIGESADIIDSIYFHEIFVSKNAMNCEIIPSCNLKDIDNSDVIIVTIGAKNLITKKKDRLHELKYTYPIIKKIALAVKEYSPESLIIMVSNPVDLLTWFMQEISDLPKDKVVGVGVALDSARYSNILKKEIEKQDIIVKSIEAIVLGLHNAKDMVMIESKIKINNKKITEFRENIDLKKILDKAREKTYTKGYFIFDQKRQRTASITAAAVAANTCLSYMGSTSITLPLAMVLEKDELQKYSNNIFTTVCIGIVCTVSYKKITVEKIKLSQIELEKFEKTLRKSITIKQNYDMLFNYNITYGQNILNGKKYFFIEEKIIPYINVKYDIKLVPHNDNLVS